MVGSEAQDVAGIEAHPYFINGKVAVHLSEAGSCKQRNAGLDLLLPFVRDADSKDWFVVFFDDDFRPAKDWIEACAEAFSTNQQLSGQSGRVLADGIHGAGYSELEVTNFLNGDATPEPNPFLDSQERSLLSLYGCNMAIRGHITATERFDEALPLYGWQEDADYSNRVLKVGTLQFNPKCKGVHMGVSSGRISGVKFGYSQIANPTYLLKKGTLSLKISLTLMCKNIAANIVKSIFMNAKKDYRGRLVGNLMALRDGVKSQCHPTKILKIK